VVWLAGPAGKNFPSRLELVLTPPPRTSQPSQCNSLANCRQLQPAGGTVNRAWDSAACRSKRYLLGLLQLDLFQQVLPRFEHIHLYKATKADLKHRWHQSHLRDSAACRLFEMSECRSIILCEVVGKDLHITPLIPLESLILKSGYLRSGYLRTSFHGRSQATIDRCYAMLDIP
jgi:hypothetical protein